MDDSGDREERGREGKSETNFVSHLFDLLMTTCRSRFRLNGVRCKKMELSNVDSFYAVRFVFH